MVGTDARGGCLSVVGVTLRLNLFREVDHALVYGALQTFYGRRGARLVEVIDPLRRYELHQRDGEWTALSWDAGWEWRTRRAAQLHVSEQLACGGLLVFTYDGDWGYEHFERGVVVDRFVKPSGYGPALDWFPGEPMTAAGNSSYRGAGGAVGLLGVLGLSLAPPPRDLTPAAPIWRAFQVSYRG
jgi:hypothetical protein